MMNDHEILRRLSLLGESRADRAGLLTASKLAPRAKLSPSALGMWWARGEVPHMWRAAALDVLGLLDAPTVKGKRQRSVKATLTEGDAA